MRVAATFAGAVGAIEFEEVVRVVTPGLGYVAGFERTRVRRAGSDEIAQLALRVTTVFRREEFGWKLVLRHAERVASANLTESESRGLGCGLFGIFGRFVFQREGWDGSPKGRRQCIAL